MKALARCRDPPCRPPSTDAENAEDCAPAMVAVVAAAGRVGDAVVLRRAVVLGPPLLSPTPSVPSCVVLAIIAAGALLLLLLLLFLSVAVFVTAARLSVTLPFAELEFVEAFDGAEEREPAAVLLA